MTRKIPIYKNKIYENYSHLGKRNFITYGLRAKRIMKSKTIKRQVSRMWTKLHKEIEKPKTFCKGIQQER